MKKVISLILILIMATSCNKTEKKRAERNAGRAINVETVESKGEKGKSQPLKAAAKKSTLYESVQMVSESYFKNHNKLDRTKLPELSMPIFGVPEIIEIPETEERTLYFDEFSNTILLLNIDEPVERVTVTALTPRGKVYKKILNAKKREFNLIKYDKSRGKKLETPAIVFPFHPLAAFDRGLWTIETYLNYSENEKMKLEVEITPASLSITPVKTPNPYDYNSSGLFKRGQTIYLFGNNEEPGSEITVALYRITDRFNEKNEAILAPFIATKTTSDSKGKFSLELIIGDDMEKGEYKLAYGITIDGVDMFGPHINVR